MMDSFISHQLSIWMARAPQSLNRFGYRMSKLMLVGWLVGLYFMQNLLKPFVVKLVSAERPEFTLVNFVG